MAAECVNHSATKAYLRVIFTFEILSTPLRAWSQVTAYPSGPCNDCKVFTCDVTKTFHILSSCPQTKLEGGLQWLHLADDVAVKWLMARKHKQQLVMCGRCLSICGNVDKSIPFIIGLLGSTAACALRVFMSACLDIQMQLHTLFIWLIVPLVMQLM